MAARQVSVIFESRAYSQDRLACPGIVLAANGPFQTGPVRMNPNESYRLDRRPAAADEF